MTLPKQIATLTELPKIMADFHAHLDVCEQCEKHPFNLCAEGKRLLEKVGIPEPKEADK